jgi:site-specific DNA recombinase
MTRAALYARFSTEKQREASIDDQFRVCDRIAREQGMTVTARYSDAGISGGTTERPGYQSMLEAARAGKFDLILAEDLSRLWRNRAEYGARSAELEDLGVHLVTALGDDTRRDGFMILTIKSAIAEHARRETSYRTRRALEGLALTGKPTGGRTYGYRSGRQWLKKTLVVDPDEAAVVRRIFERRAAGGTPYEIARELNTDRVPAPRSHYWSDRTVKFILANARYAGRLAWGATVSQGGARDSRRTRHVERPGGPLVVRAIPAIVDPVVWATCNPGRAVV